MLRNATGADCSHTMFMKLIMATPKQIPWDEKVSYCLRDSTSETLTFGPDMSWKDLAKIGELRSIQAEAIEHLEHL